MDFRQTLRPAASWEEEGAVLMSRVQAEQGVARVKAGEDVVNGDDADK